MMVVEWSAVYEKLCGDAKSVGLWGATQKDLFGITDMSTASPRVMTLDPRP